MSVRKTDQKWAWSGCGDNAVYGYKKSRQFLEALFRRKADVKTLIMLHNNEVGRLVSLSVVRRAPQLVAALLIAGVRWQGTLHHPLQLRP